MLRRCRRAVQLGFLILMFLIPLLNLYEIYSITGTYYAINVGGLGIADPVVIFQAVFAAGELTVPLLSAALFPVILALIFGRLWCGWMCPYHLLADCTAWLRSRITHHRSGRKTLRANVSRFTVLLIGTVVAGAIGIPVLNYFSAPGILSTEAMIFVKERSVSLEFAFIAALLLLEISLLPRFWCRSFCPTGAFLSLLKTPYTLMVENTTKQLTSSCCKESHCAEICPMGLEPFREAANLLCTNCGLCVDACPSKRLRFRGFQST
jgi:ferredoxin-type protein NapH